MPSACSATFRGRGIYDNMKTAVDRVGSGKARQVNSRFAAMASHYLFDTTFCNPASGWEKGQVEKNVQDARRRLLDGKPSTVPTIDAPQALVLRQEAKADVERYDALRGKAVRHVS